jgi:signal transduction histidine kinase
MPSDAANAWPLRRLLLAAYVGLLGAALLGVSLGIRVLVGRFLDRAEEQSALDVSMESWQRLGLPPAQLVGPGTRPSLIVLQQPGLAQLGLLVRDLGRPERQVRWRDARAGVTIEAGGRPAGPLHATPPPPPGVQWWGLPLGTPEGALGTLEMTLDRRHDRELLAALGRYLALCSVGVLLLAVWLCSRLSAYWLAPLQTLAQTLERLADGDLSARPPQPEGPMIPSEWTRLHQSADEMAGRLEASFSAQRRFIADASHELRTPLTAVAAMAEMLGSEDLPPEGHRKAQKTILRESQRMSRLVEDLLALSRAAEGRPLPQQECHLSATLGTLIEEFSELQPDRVVRLDSPDSAVLRAPVTLVSTILRNLIENALRYSDADVQVRVSDSPKEVAVSVQDSGCGIPSEELCSVFDRFYRCDHSRSRATGGSGLGLAIVKSLVERTGGQIELSSQLGEGTTARVFWSKDPAP